MAIIKYRPSKLKFCTQILLGNHVKSIFPKYELNPTKNKYILQSYSSKKVKNHHFFDIDEFGRLGLPTVKTKFRPPKLKIYTQIHVGNHVIRISTKYEPNPTENKYIFQSCGSKKVKNHDFFDFDEF